MMNKNRNISISLFRVSSDTKYLDMVFSCPFDYYFSSLQLEVRFIDGKEFKKNLYDLSAALFVNEVDESDDEEFIQHRFAVKLPLEKIGITVPAIYYGSFKAKPLDGGDDISATAICSDVVHAYRCIMDELFMDPDGTCEDVVSDEIIRKYLLIYGHTAAMAAGDIETAQEYFRLIGNCFDKCGPKGRGNGSCCDNRRSCSDVPPRPHRNNSCNCGRR